MALPRSTLPARFGNQLLTRLDQALGQIPEPLTPLQHQTTIAAQMDFDGVVSSLEAIWAVFQHLVGQLITQLTRRGRGARRLEVQLLHPTPPR